MSLPWPSVPVHLFLTNNLGVPVFYLTTNGTLVATGMLWEDGTTQSTAGGGGATGNFSYNESPGGQGQGVTEVTLAHVPTAGTLELYKNGVRLTPNVDYAVTGSAVTLIPALNADDRLLCDYSY